VFRKSNATKSSKKVHCWWALAFLVLAIGIAGFMYLGSVLHNREPNYYQPARKALVNARERLEQSYTHEETAIKELKITHRELETAIAALNKARVDPAYQKKIATLRTRLQALEDIERLEQTSPRQLQQSYHQIANQLSVLIEKLERSRNTVPSASSTQRSTRLRNSLTLPGQS
jgi:chromosome segregation ATPase